MLTRLQPPHKCRKIQTIILRFMLDVGRMLGREKMEIQVRKKGRKLVRLFFAFLVVEPKFVLGLFVGDWFQIGLASIGVVKLSLNLMKTLK